MNKQLACIKASSVELYFSAKLLKVSPGCTCSVNQPLGTGQSVGGVALKVAVAEGVNVGERDGVGDPTLAVCIAWVGEGVSVCVAASVGGTTGLWKACVVSVATGEGSSATRSNPSVNAREKLPRTMLAESRAATTPRSTWRI